MLQVWVILTVVTSLFQCLHGSVELEQIQPEPGDPICLGEEVAYLCEVVGNQLLWIFEGQNGSSESFFPGTPIGVKGELGSFTVILENRTSNGEIGYVFTSEAKSTHGLISTDIGKNIYCGNVNDASSILITVSEPEIENASYCLNTISWSPPPCDAYCTVSVNGQDIDTVPCGDGNLTSANDPDLNTENVNITAVDEVGNVVMVQASPAKDCKQPTHVTMTYSTVDSSATAAPTSGNNTTEIIVSVIVILMFVVVVVVMVIVFGVWYRLKGWKRKQCKEFVLYDEKSEEVTLKGHESSYPDEDSLSGRNGQRGSHQENQTQKGNASQAKSEEPKDSDSSAKDQGHNGGNPSISGQGQEETKHSAIEEEKGGSGSQTDPKTEENTRPSTKIPVKTSRKLIVDEQGQVHRSFEFPITHCSISPSSITPVYIAIAGPKGNVRILNCDTGELVKKHQSSTCIVSLEWLEQYSNEETEYCKLMVGSRTKLKIVNPISGKLTATVNCSQFHQGSSIIRAAHSIKAFIFALSCMLPRKEDDANNCVGLLVMGDVRKQEDYCSLRVASPVSCMVLNHDDKQLITGNMEGKLTIYDVGVENALYTATFCCDWSTPHGIVYDLQYSYNEMEVYSIGENGQFLLQSNIEKKDSSNQPFTNCFELLPGAVSTVKATEEALPARGQLFRFIKGKPCVLTSSYSQGIVYKLKGGQSAAVKLTLPECDANITCVDIRDALEGKFFCVLGCDNNKIHVMKMDVKE